MAILLNLVYCSLAGTVLNMNIIIMVFRMQLGKNHFILFNIPVFLDIFPNS